MQVVALSGMGWNGQSQRSTPTPRGKQERSNRGSNSHSHLYKFQPCQPTSSSLLLQITSLYEHERGGTANRSLFARSSTLSITFFFFFFFCRCRFSRADFSIFTSPSEFPKKGPSPGRAALAIRSYSISNKMSAKG